MSRSQRQTAGNGAAAPAQTPAESIVVEHVSLYYPLLVRQRQNSRVRFRCLLKDLFGGGRSGPDGDFFAALKDISFQVNRGEVVGLIGPNGAGKSTLLRVLAGIEKPDRGRVVVHGRSTSLLNLGVGFRPQLSGRENIYLNSLLYGIPRSKVDQYIQDVIELCDIGEFVDAPVETYSAGMKARLGFSVATRIDPQILLLDEVIGAGDAAFKARAGNIIDHYRANEKTVVVATHSEGFILSKCDKAIFLNRGELLGFGYPEDVLDEYRRFTQSQLRRKRIFDVRAGADDDGDGPPSADVRVGICAGEVRYEHRLREVLAGWQEEHPDASFELVTVMPHEAERLDLHELVHVLLVPDVGAFTEPQYVGLRRFVRKGGVLVLGPRAARLYADSAGHEVKEDNERLVNHCLGALGQYEPAYATGRYLLSDFELTRPNELLPGIPPEQPFRDRDDVETIPGVLLLGTVGSYTLARARVKDPALPAEVGVGDVLVARASGEGLVFRFACDLERESTLFGGMLQSILVRDGLDLLRETTPGEYGVPSDTAVRPLHAHDAPSLEACRVRLLPVVGTGDHVRLMSGEELRDALALLADLAATQVCLVVKHGSALVPMEGIERYPFVPKDRDVLSEAMEMAGALGLEIVPTIAAFVEHWPGEPARASAFLEANPEALHLSQRQREEGYVRPSDLERKQERLLASPHLEIVRERLLGAVAAAAGREGIGAVHLEFFRFTNDRGGFSPSELQAKGGLRVNDEARDHEQASDACLAALAEELSRRCPRTQVSLEAYHAGSVGLPCSSLTGGVLTKKNLPLNVYETYFSRYVEQVRAARPIESYEVLLDAHHRPWRDLADRIALARRAGCRRAFIDGYDALAALEENDRRKLGTSLRHRRS